MNRGGEPAKIALGLLNLTVPNEWLPAMVDGTPRGQVIADLLPSSARWWAAFGPLPIIAGIWAFEAWRRDGFTHVREFLEGTDDETR